MGLTNPGIEPKSPTLLVDSLPGELQGKPTNTGVGSLSLLQQIFLTQELNRGLLHFRQVLYQMSYQGSPVVGLPFISHIPCARLCAAFLFISSSGYSDGSVCCCHPGVMRGRWTERESNLTQLSRRQKMGFEKQWSAFRAPVPNHCVPCSPYKLEGARGLVGTLWLL